MKIFDTLSRLQKKVVFEKEGKFVIRACPGSGKTYSVAARFVKKLSNWRLNNQGIAVLSFTNVAWQEIERQAKIHFGIKKLFLYPHFLGTIDSFINRNIFLPFGHLVMGCCSRPILVGEPHGPWSGNSYSSSFFPNLSYDINGKIYPINKFKLQRNWENNRYIIISKKKLNKLGYANQNDANYFAMKILECYPNIAKAIIQRFPEFIIDEAQDTSEIQMRIIDLLIDNGLKNILLAGDPDQAIFEWHNANPTLFVDKYNLWKDNSLIINENRRSSQNICNCICRMSTFKEKSIAINKEVKDYRFVPLITVYKRDNINELIRYFLNLCTEHDIEISPEKVAILVRSKKILNTVTGLVEIEYKDQPWKSKYLYSKDFAKGKYLFQNNEIRRGFLLIQNAAIKALTNSHFCTIKDIERFVELKGFVEFRKNIYSLIKMLPDTNSYNIGEWIKITNNIFHNKKINIILKINDTKGNISFDELFKNESNKIIYNNCTMGTIHSVKGESYKAVLLILKQKGIGKYYKTLIKDKVSICDSEELRIVYVGITRASNLLMLAVPDNENKKAWESKLFDN